MARKPRVETPATSDDAARQSVEADTKMAYAKAIVEQKYYERTARTQA